MGDGDVVIYYKLLPTEDSIRLTAAKITDNVNKGLGRSGGGGGRSGSKRQPSTLENLYRLFSKRQEFSTRTKAFERLTGIGNMFGGQAGTASGGAAGEGGAGGAAGGGGAAAGGGGLLAGILGGVIALVAIGAIIMASMLIIGGFFEAVGPFIKVVTKLFAMFFLIALLPALKILMKSLPLIWSVLKIIAQGIAFVLQAIIDGLTGFVGNGEGGIDWLKLLMVIFAPIPTLLITLFVGMFTTVLPAIISAMNTLLAAGIGLFLAPIAFVVDTVFGAGTWQKVVDAVQWIADTILGTAWEAVKAGILWIAGLFSPDSKTWLDINAAVDFIGTNIFGIGIWNAMELAIQFIADNVFNEKGIWNPIKLCIDAIKSLFDSFKEALQGIVNIVNAFKLPFSGDGGGGEKAKDFISRPGGGVQMFSADDTIIGMKNPGALGGGGVTVNNTFNIDAGADKTELKRILEEFSRLQARDLRTRTSYSAGVYA